MSSPVAVKALEPAFHSPQRVSRSELLHLMRDEAKLILDRALTPGADKPLYAAKEEGPVTLQLLEGVQWYLDMSMDWGLVTLAELFATPTGTLLDIGCYYGLIAGSAWRTGWKVSAVDVNPLPNFSGLAIPERQVTSAVCNISVDPLPFEDQTFDAVLMNEVLEHLMYPPVFLFNEIRRVLKPRGRLYLTTPNPAAFSKIVRLVRGKNNEPLLENFMKGETFNYGGLTFFKSQREAKIWTVEEIREVLTQSSIRVRDYYYYGNTVGGGRFTTSSVQRIKVLVNRWLRPLVRRNRLMGGGTIVVGEPQ